jgi:ribonuclease T2
MRRPTSRLLASLAILAAMIASPAAAACQPPRGLAPAPAYAAPAGEIARTPTAFYLLAIAWGPEWRRTEGQIAATAQKLDDIGARRLFLHGLWPNGEGPPYPRYCRTVGTIDPATVKAMYCRTPSVELLQHEWQAHGSCGWDNPAAYFADARRLYDGLKIPTLRGPTLTADEIRQAFLKRNPQLRADGVIIADRDGRFSEARLCYDMAFKPRACPAGQGVKAETSLILTPAPDR